MKANEDNMTATQAAGYIAGVGVAFLRRHYKIFAFLIALVGFGIILSSVFSGGVFIGLSMISISIVLWLMFSTPRK